MIRAAVIANRVPPCANCKSGCAQCGWSGKRPT